MQKTLTSFDIAAVVLELKEQIEGARIQNIYQIKGKIVILKLHQPSQPALNLLIESGRRLHLTSYTLEKPQRPPAFCMALRKHLRNGTVVSIAQYEFERIITIKIKAKEGEFKLVLELFGNGNIILVETQGTIRQALVFKKMRDRNILRGEAFQHAPSSGENPLHLEPMDLLELKKFESLEVVKALTKLLSIGGGYSEEILLRAQIDKEKRCELLEESDFHKISTALNEILLHLETRKLEPCIVEERGRRIDVVPIPLRKYEQLECRKFESFNEALDEYYARTILQQEVTAVAEKVDLEVDRWQRTLRKQKASLEEAKREAERARSIGDMIYAHLHELQTLLQRTMPEKRSGRTWQEIISKIENEKTCGQTPSIYFTSLDEKKLVLIVSIEDLTFDLSLRNTVQANASTYYNRAKKAKKKVKGAEKAIRETLCRIEELKRQKIVAIDTARPPITKRRKKAWYEKFWWFHTSESLLVVGGKDAVTNEILIKKHTEPHDFVFHADIAGAPFVLIKTGGKTPSQQSISEAAQLAASHSRAWKAQFGAIDVYWVYPKQVSKTPPSGAYLPKGAFMIRGPKNYVRKTPLRLAIGVDTGAKPPSVIGGPKEAIKCRTDFYVEIAPGDLSSRKLAGKILQKLEQRASKKLREQLSKIPLEEIQSFIPFGKGETTDH